MSKLAEKPLQLDYQLYRTKSNKRVILIACMTVLTAAVLVGRLFYLQVLQGDYFTQKAMENGVRMIPVLAPRGIIYDRKGHILATNKISHALLFDPRKSSPILTRLTMRNLSEYLNIPETELLKSLEAGRPDQPIYLQHNLDNQNLARIKENQASLPGIQIVSSMERFYPENDLASHMLGYMGQITSEDIKKSEYRTYAQGTLMGKAGLEKTYEHLLHGQDGQDQITFNLTDADQAVSRSKLPISGHSLRLTIDKTLQITCQKLLRDNHHQGAIVVMDIQTGGLLALVSEPTYNLNLFSQGLSQQQWDSLQNAPAHPFLDRTLSAYAPGSIFKIVTAAAALENGYITPERTFISRGYFNLGGHIFYDWNRGGFGQVNIYQALAYSIDTVFYEVSLEMKIERIKEYAEKFGLSRKTGIDLPHETVGIIPDPAWKKKYWHQDWMPGDTVNSSIGQGYIQITPLQAVQMIATVANGGHILKPQLVQSVLDDKGKIIKSIEPEVVAEVNLSKRTWDVIKTGLKGAVQYGTTQALAIDGFPAAGKTGTAETHLRNHTHAWVVAYAPTDFPRYAIAVFLEHGGSGGGKAAPLGRKVFEALLAQEPKRTVKKPS